MDSDSHSSCKRSASEDWNRGRQVSNREIIERFNSLRKRMTELPDMAGTALAVVVTQRLMDHYLLQPEDQRSRFVARWAEMMPLLWKTVSHPSAELKRTLKSKLIENTDESLGREYAMDAYRYEEDAGNACICSIEAYCGDRMGVAAAASQLLTHAQSRAQTIAMEIGEDRMSANAQSRVLRFQRVELDRLENAISLLEREGFSTTLLPQLRDLLDAGKTGTD
jgi:hypothetical protein